MDGKRWGKWTRVYFLDARLAGKLAILFVAAADNMEVDKNTSLLEGRKVAGGEGARQPKG